MFEIYPQGPAERIAVSRERFDQVPVLRGVYILAYVVYMFVWFGWTLAVALGSLPPFGAYVAALTAIIACLVLFIPRMMSVMRTMGYSKFLIAGVVFASFFPIPGILAVAFVDRRIGEAWEAAQRGDFATAEQPNPEDGA